MTYTVTPVVQVSEFVARIGKSVEACLNSGGSQDDVVGTIFAEITNEIDTINDRLDRMNGLV